jgi:hypothetical protein
MSIGCSISARRGRSGASIPPHPRSPARPVRAWHRRSAPASARAPAGSPRASSSRAQTALPSATDRGVTPIARRVLGAVERRFHIGAGQDRCGVAIGADAEQHQIRRPFQILQPRVGGIARSRLHIGILGRRAARRARPWAGRSRQHADVRCSVGHRHQPIVDRGRSSRASSRTSSPPAFHKPRSASCRRTRPAGRRRARRARFRR